MTSLPGQQLPKEVQEIDESLIWFIGAAAEKQRSRQMVGLGKWLVNWFPQASSLRDKMLNFVIKSNTCP